MQVLLKEAFVEETPLDPSPLFDSMIEYNIMGRSTCNPVAVIDGYVGGSPSHFVFTVAEVLFEIAKRDMHGYSTLVANIILEDLKRNRQCNCHKGSDEDRTPIESGVHFFPSVKIGSAPIDDPATFA